MAVKIEHTVGGHSQDICNSASLMFMPAKYGASARVKLAKIYAFVPRNLFACTEYKIKIFFVVFSIIFHL